MRGLRKYGLSFSLLVVGGAAAALESSDYVAEVYDSSIPRLDGTYPAPRYQPVPEIKSIDELMPNARYIVASPMPYTGDQRTGYAVKGGEKILFVANSHVDPWVVEALVRALREKNCKVDIISLDAGPPTITDAGEGLKRSVESIGTYQGPGWPVKVAQEEKYDKIIGQGTREGGEEKENLKDTAFSYLIDWPTREMLADPHIPYPEELIRKIDESSWKLLRTASRVRMVDPEGTDFRFTWFRDYWQVVEGNHPKLNIAGYGTHVYGPGRSEIPIISGHLMGYPFGIVLPESDAEGVVAGTSQTSKFFPHFRIRMKGNRAVSMEGGGTYGRLWWDLIQRYKNVQLPHYPQPGIDWLVEVAIGTHPWVVRPFNRYQSVAASRGASDVRNRAGVIHIGIGQALDNMWARKRGYPDYHYHVVPFFPTLTVTLDGGREAKVVDKGHLTALDDPEVRQFASKYGDPAKLLSERWIPAIPGINAPGDYWKDYARDPDPWVKNDLLRVYKKEIERSKGLYP